MTPISAQDRKWRSRLERSWRVTRFVAVMSNRSVRQRAKNCIRPLIGRKRQFDESGLFLWQCVLHLSGIRPISKITCTGLPSEGAGSQALMVMNAINFARFFGLTYVHSPFRSVAHADRPMEQYASAWESHFNLGAGEAECGSERRSAVNFCYNFDDLDVCLAWQERADELGDHFKAMIPDLRRKYYLNKRPRRTDELTVAVHVRRGNALPDDESYYTRNKVIVRTMSAVRAVLEGRKTRYKMCLFSEGARADFDELALPDVEFFLDADPVWTMQELIEADIFILAKGCYSYCAGLLSDGIRIFEAIPPMEAGDLPGWKWLSIPASERWIPCGTDGSFDVPSFERQLSQLIEEKDTSAAKHRAAL